MTCKPKIYNFVVFISRSDRRKKCFCFHLRFYFLIEIESKQCLCLFNDVVQVKGN